MGYDAISNAHACAFAKVSSRNKRGNKLAKLKENKLDCKRDQGYIKDSSKECKMGTNEVCGAITHLIPIVRKGRQMHRHVPRITRDVHEVLPVHNSEVITRKTSSVSRKSGCTNLSSDCHRIRGGNSINGSFSSSCTEDDRDKGCLDDWESVADALSAESGTEVLVLEHHSESESHNSEDGSECVNNSHPCQGNSRAWCPDDVFRPPSLPRISGQRKSLTQNSGPNFSSSPASLSWQRVAVPEPQPSVCPICCEDFDVTDSSFLPCPCGFRLCLFCHKRILEVDGRCPGCRKSYGSANLSANAPL